VPCEKPVCTRVCDCRAVVDKARESAVPVWVAMECRCMPAIRRLLEEVDRGRGRCAWNRFGSIATPLSKGRRLEPLPSSNRRHAGREMLPQIRGVAFRSGTGPAFSGDLGTGVPGRVAGATVSGVTGRPQAGSGRQPQGKAEILTVRFRARAAGRILVPPAPRSSEFRRFRDKTQTTSGRKRREDRKRQSRQGQRRDFGVGRSVAAWQCHPSLRLYQRGP